MTCRLRMILLLLLGTLTVFDCLHAPASLAAPLRRAVWVYSNEITDPVDRQALVERSVASGVTDLYLSVYRPTPNSTGRLMYEDAVIAELITIARRFRIKVWAAYGSPGWPSWGCDPEGFPLQRMAEVVAYRAANPTASFRGVMLDVEPEEPQTEADFQALLSMYECFRAFLPKRIRLAAAIRFFWQSPGAPLVQFPAGTGPTKEPFQHIIDMPLDTVVVMGYRDFAGPADCSRDGILCLDKDEIAYADHAQRRRRRILVGLETSDCAPGCGPEKVTFAEEGQTVLDEEQQRVVEFFAANRSFDGFALHRYGGSYLSGLPGWPTTNPVWWQP